MQVSVIIMPQIFGVFTTMGCSLQKHFNVFRSQLLTTQSGKVCSTAWLDRKVVMMIYTNSDPQSVTSILRQQSDGNKEVVECPLALKSYNRSR